MNNKQMSIHDIYDYFEDMWAGSEEDSNKFIHKMTKYGFNESVSDELGKLLLGWSNAPPGDSAKKYATQFMKILKDTPKPDVLSFYAVRRKTGKKWKKDKNGYNQFLAITSEGELVVATGSEYDGIDHVVLDSSIWKVVFK